MFQGKASDDIALFRDERNPDAIIECTLASVPDFEDQAMLISKVQQCTERFITAVSGLLAD